MFALFLVMNVINLRRGLRPKNRLESSGEFSCLLRGAQLHPIDRRSLHGGVGPSWESSNLKGTRVSALNQGQAAINTAV